MFQLNRVSFSVAKRTLLDKTTLAFEQGKIYGLIGHNGSGKSTLIKLMARQQLPSSGDILFNRKNIRNWENRKFAKQVAYLPQNLPQSTNMTSKELIAMGRYAWKGLFGRMNEEDKRAVEQAIQLTHTQKFADQFVDTLSGGERARIWLAMLLAQQSRFLLLDEPLAPLDISHQVEVMQLIHHLTRELNLGVVIVIHDINLASRFCDELIALHSGKLLIQGVPQDIINSHTLNDIYGIRLNVIQHPHCNKPVSFF
ncbi:ABC transporter ATP-binding protein [Rodentibacter caecimuris]|uniref:Iron-hydroxamate transporter ATP-binding subunit n=1 Tax=Rodentibacter caecimuris TaxID=1796644 RepID=A0ABX3KWK6_9PAST|nr:iron-hydroxamate transporter ATP-binding subunit [Rodentibacter heylii]